MPPTNGVHPCIPRMSNGCGGEGGDKQRCCRCLLGRAGAGCPLERFRGTVFKLRSGPYCWHTQQAGASTAWERRAGTGSLPRKPQGQLWKTGLTHVTPSPVPAGCRVFSPLVLRLAPSTATESLCLIPGAVTAPFSQLLTSFVCCLSPLT